MRGRGDAARGCSLTCPLAQLLELPDLSGPCIRQRRGEGGCVRVAGGRGQGVRRSGRKGSQSSGGRGIEGEEEKGRERGVSRPRELLRTDVGPVVLLREHLRYAPDDLEPRGVREALELHEALVGVV